MHEFGDDEGLSEFFRNLHDDECSIIAQHGKNLKILQMLKTRSDSDTENTAKSLAMDG